MVKDTDISGNEGESAVDAVHEDSMANNLTGSGVLDSETVQKQQSLNEEAWQSGVVSGNLAAATPFTQQQADFALNSGAQNMDNVPEIIGSVVAHAAEPTDQPPSSQEELNDIKQQREDTNPAFGIILAGVGLEAIANGHISNPLDLDGGALFTTATAELSNPGQAQAQTTGIMA